MYFSIVRSFLEAAPLTRTLATLATRWFREAGEMPPIPLAPPSARYLSLTERDDIALLRAQQHGVREIARQLGRVIIPRQSRGMITLSTISRELRRNAATRGSTLQYRATVAQWKAERAAERPKAAKLAQNKRLRANVQERLSGVVLDV